MSAVVYWDTSALLAIFIDDAASRQARKWWKQDTLPASSWLAFPEALAALGQRHRQGHLGAGEHRQALAELETTWAGFHKVPVGPKLAPELRRVLRLHGLRGADAVHLASALLIHRRTGGDAFRFAVHDRALATAAQAEGLELAWEP